MGTRDVAFLLDGVAEGNAIRRSAGGEHHLDFGNRGRIETGAEPSEEPENFRRRIGLHGVEHTRVRQRLGEGQIVVANDVEIDDEARTIITAVAQKLADALGHGALPSYSSRGGPTAHCDAGFEPCRQRALGTR